MRVARLAAADVMVWEHLDQEQIDQVPRAAWLQGPPEHQVRQDEQEERSEKGQGCHCQERGIQLLEDEKQRWQQLPGQP